MKTTLVMLVLILAGCGTNKETAMQSKADAALRQAVAEAAAAGRPDTLQVMGGCDGWVSDERRKSLAAAGASVQTVVGETFVALVPAGRVGDVASLDFVRSLELSKELKPLPR